MTDSLWLEFSERLAALGGRVVDLDEVNAIEPVPAWRDEDCAGLALQLPPAGCVWDAVIGITTADLAVAETGSLFVSSGPGKARMSSLACERHIVLIPQDRIVATMEEAFEQLTDRTTVIITGPSRTADIEGVLVRGIHGPRELWVVLTDFPDPPP